MYREKHKKPSFAEIYFSIRFTEYPNTQNDFGAGSTKGLNPHLDLKLRLLFLIQTKPVVIDLKEFHKATKFLPSLSRSGLNFC